MGKFGEQWSNLSAKTKVAYVTALVAFTIGWGLAIAGFILGAGVVSDSVLWILGQSLVYAASVFGVGMYVTASVTNMKKSIARFMVDEKRLVDKQMGLEEENNEEEIEQYES